ncbi:hypothetical protein [Inmirania thermothiophila]|uniref:hypothetical protein n=1 Tax=Inmirania thermothiophila TaxID=1750597 RepID=UPI000F4A36DC|nr:hypothetical protein [Inmirania thermothiophila]
MVATEDLPRLEAELVNRSDARLVNLLQHESTCYYFVLAFWKDGKPKFLPVDAATDYRRNGRVWFSAEELLKGRRRWKDFWVASLEVEFRYLLVKKLLKGAVPEYSARRIQELAEELDGKALEFCDELLGEALGEQVFRWIRDGNWGAFEKHLSRLQKALKRERLRKDPLNPLRYWLPEGRRIFRRWRYPTGLFVVVLGPDGSGKSTLLERLERDLAGAFRRTARFHLMPGILRKKGDGGPVTDPHGKAPRSWLASVLKLVYYLLDYNLGYWLKVRPALVRSTLVLFDRYYDDLLVDPKRYRYGGPMELARRLRRFIPRPDLWFILDVPEEELLRRKQEVPLDELRRQREAYRNLAGELPNAVLLDGSLPPEEVARQAEEVILEYLHERYLSRRSLWFPGASLEEEQGYLQKALGAIASNPGQAFLRLALPDGRGFLLPANARRAAVRGLSLYAPQKPKAKALRKALETGLRLGVARHMLPKVQLGTRELEGFLAEILGERDLSLAVSLGTPGPHRKPVVQVMNFSGEVLGYVKIGWNEATRRLVENEARTLQRLQGENLSFLIPEVLFSGEWQGRYLCVQSAPPAGAAPAPSEWHPLYEEALQGLASLGVRRYRLKESPFWKELTGCISGIEAGYRRHMVEQAMDEILNRWGNVELHFHPAHGDFAPWNALRVNGRLYLYDWEYALESAPAGYDLFHFVVQRAWLVDGKAMREILRLSERNLPRVLTDRNSLEIDDDELITLLFSLSLLGKAVLKREINDLKSAYRLIKFMNPCEGELMICRKI